MHAEPVSQCTVWRNANGYMQAVVHADDVLANMEGGTV